MLTVSLQPFPPQAFLEVQLQREPNQASTYRANAGTCTGGGREGVSTFPWTSVEQQLLVGLRLSISACNHGREQSEIAPHRKG